MVKKIIQIVLIIGLTSCASKGVCDSYDNSKSNAKYK